MIVAEHFASQHLISVNNDMLSGILALREILKLCCSEDEEDVRYLSIPLQLEELIECLDGDRYEKDLVGCLKEMKDEIVRQMTMTEDLTKENQGSRKSALEIANG